MLLNTKPGKTLLFFLALVSVIAFSMPSNAATIWEKRKKAVEDVKEGGQETQEIIETSSEAREDTLATIDPSEIFIPDQYGTVIETHEGTNGKLILHVQDAHMNYEGQINQAHVLESLIEDYDLNLILMEGKVTDRDFTYIRYVAPLEERIEKADKLLKEGWINGVNYLNIATDYPMTIQGIENKELYDKNIDSLWQIDNFKALAQEYVTKMISISDALKGHIYTESLKELDAKKKDYENEAIDILSYYEYLYEKAEENDAPLYAFPNFNNLIKASNLEREIDLVKIRDGSATSEDMERYNEYTELTRDLNINALFKEEPMLEDYIEDILVTNTDQRNLLKISKALSIIKNLLIIKVVPEEYSYFQENKKDFDPKFWQDFLNEKSKALILSLDIPANFHIISDNLGKIEYFYGKAFERDKIFVENIDKHMNEKNTDLSAVIAGGFHTPTLTKLLREAGYSYVVISPKVTTETEDELYRSALKREWLPDVK